jgi:hypothetical protein
LVGNIVNVDNDIDNDIGDGNNDGVGLNLIEIGGEGKGSGGKMSNVCSNCQNNIADQNFDINGDNNGDNIQFNNDSNRGITPDEGIVTTLRQRIEILENEERTKLTNLLQNFFEIKNEIKNDELLKNSLEFFSSQNFELHNEHEQVENLQNETNLEDPGENPPTTLNLSSLPLPAQNYLQKTSHLLLSLESSLEIHATEQSLELLHTQGQLTELTLQYNSLLSTYNQVCEEFSKMQLYINDTLPQQQQQNQDQISPEEQLKIQGEEYEAVIMNLKKEWDAKQTTHFETFTTLQNEHNDVIMQLNDVLIKFGELEERLANGGMRSDEDCQKICQNCQNCHNPDQSDTNGLNNTNNTTTTPSTRLIPLCTDIDDNNHNSTFSSTSSSSKRSIFDDDYNFEQNKLNSGVHSHSQKNPQNSKKNYQKNNFNANDDASQDGSVISRRYPLPDDFGENAIENEWLSGVNDDDLGLNFNHFDVKKIHNNNHNNNNRHFYFNNKKNAINNQNNKNNTDPDSDHKDQVITMLQQALDELLQRVQQAERLVLQYQALGINLVSNTTASKIATSNFGKNCQICQTLPKKPEICPHQNSTFAQNNPTNKDYKNPNTQLVELNNNQHLVEHQTGIDPTALQHQLVVLDNEKRLFVEVGQKDQVSLVVSLNSNFLTAVAGAIGAVAGAVVLTGGL